MATGFFGKLPASGDFVARGLPAGARPVVDRWLTHHLAPLARQPAGWPREGLRAVIGHGDSALAMLILPGRDSSGRAFPLAAVTAADGAGQAQVDVWADAALLPLVRALGGELDADGLFALLAGQGVTGADAALPVPLIWAPGGMPCDPAAFLRQMLSSG